MGCIMIVLQNKINIFEVCEIRNDNRFARYFIFQFAYIQYIVVKTHTITNK